MPRIQRRFLLGSQWTARIPLESSDGECHFEVIELRRSTDGEIATLRAVLTDRTYTLAVSAFENSQQWLTGWRSLPLS